MRRWLSRHFCLPFQRTSSKQHSEPPSQPTTTQTLPAATATTAETPASSATMPAAANPSPLFHAFVAAAKLTFGGTPRGFDPNNSDSLQKFLYLQQLANSLTIADLDLPADLFTQPARYAHHLHVTSVQRHRPFRLPPCTYVGLYDDADLNINVFILHKDTEMPLHDHPRMHGLVKCLAGHMTMRSWTAVNAAGRPCANRLDVEQPPPVTFAVRQEQPVVLQAASPAVLVTPDLHNYHKMVPMYGQPAAFLDVLAPPYRQDGSDCTYYKLLEQVAGGGAQLRETSGGGALTDLEKGLLDGLAAGQAMYTEPQLMLVDAVGPTDWWCNRVAHGQKALPPAESVEHMVKPAKQAGKARMNSKRVLDERTES